MDVEDTLIPITYRPIVLFSIGIAGWACNLFVLSKTGIDPVSLLQLHQADKQTPLYKPIFALSGILSAMVLINLMLYRYYQSSVIAIMPYISALALLLWPGQSLFRKERIRFTRMLKRVLSPNIYAPVFFSDIILADMMTSFSNVFGDFFIASCVIIAGHNSSSFMDNTHNIYYRDIMVPLLISLPYLIRLRQCISEYIESKEKRHLLNSLKYASSIPVVIFSAVQKKATFYITESGTVPQHWYLKEDVIFQFWMLFVLVNSMYSFWWDISMDWNLITITTQQQPTVHFRRHLYFTQPIWYILAVSIDFLLRITWSLKLSTHVYLRTLDGNIFFIQLLEVIRRWVWVIFRMENEWVKKIYTSLPFDNFRMNLIDRKASSSSGLLSPIEEEDP